MKTMLDRIYNTKAYDKLEDFCDDDKGGDSEFIMDDKFDRQLIVNFLYPIIKKELENKLKGGENE